MKKIFLLGILISLHFVTFAQEEFSEGEPEEIEGRHNIAFVLSHSRIGQGRSETGEKQFTSVPSLAIDYNYWISEKFALGLHNDLLNETFFVESEKNGDLIERERPFTILLYGGYKVGEHWGFGLGVGAEFAKGENYFVTRISVEYGVEIRDGWEVFGSLNQDFRADVYNITSLGIGIGKRFLGN